MGKLESERKRGEEAMKFNRLKIELITHQDKKRGETIVRENLRAARKAAGLTQKQVADYLNVTVQNYQAIEYGARLGRISAWDKLEDLFHIPQRTLREMD